MRSITASEGGPVLQSKIKRVRFLGGGIGQLEVHHLLSAVNSSKFKGSIKHSDFIVVARHDLSCSLIVENVGGHQLEQGDGPGVYLHLDYHLTIGNILQRSRLVIVSIRTAVDINRIDSKELALH